MGIYDRDYYRDDSARSGSRFGTMQMWSITTWLIVINVAVFLIDGVMGRRFVLGELIEGQPVQVSGPMGWLELWGHFSVGQALFHLQVWRFLTFQFLHV